MIEVLANNITQGVESAIGAGFTAALVIFLFIWAIGIVFLVINTAIITWTVKKVWYARPKRRTIHISSNNGY